MIRRLWKRLQHRAANALLKGVMYSHQAPRGVADGASYAQPIPVPRRIRELAPEQQQAWLMESARQSLWFQFDTKQRTSADNPVNMPNEDPLEEWDSTTRQAVLENCHIAYDRNPIAKAGVDYTTSFVVGTGMAITYQNDQVREVLEAFIESDDNPVRELEKTLCADLQIDGELFLRFFEKSGVVTMVPLRPWECVDIETDPGFTRRVKHYVFKIDGKDEKIPADEILHVTINRRSYHQRGKPELYVILPWLRAFKEWLEDRARQNYWRGALVWHVSVDSNSPAAIANVAARYAKPITPGSVSVESSKVSVEPLTNTVGAGDVSQDGRQIKLMNAVGLRLPEYFLADGENATLASTSNQELPALTKFEDFQQIMVDRVWVKVFKRVVQAAIDANTLPDTVEVEDSLGNSTGEQVDTLDAFAAAYAPLKQDDPKTIAEALMMYHGADVLSTQTVTEEAGYDFEIEQERINEERETEMEAMTQGLVPMPPGMVPDGMGGPNGAGEEKPEAVADAVQ